VPVTWVGNTARKVGSGNEYTYAIQMTNGTHYIGDNDFETGKTGRYDLAGTYTGNAAFTLPCNTSPALTATGVKQANIGEVVMPAPGMLVGMTTRCSTGGGGSCAFRPTLGTAAGGAAAATGTAFTNAGTTSVTGTQEVAFAKGDRLGYSVSTSGSAAGANLLVTFHVILNGSDL
jgi:hypothetical protein